MKSMLLMLFESGEMFTWEKPHINISSAQLESWFKQCVWDQIQDVRKVASGRLSRR